MDTKIVKDIGHPIAQRSQQTRQPTTPQEKAKAKDEALAKTIGQVGEQAAKAVPVVGKIPGFSKLAGKMAEEQWKQILAHKELLFIGLGLLALVTAPFWFLPAILLSPILFPAGLVVAVIFFLRDMNKTE